MGEIVKRKKSVTTCPGLPYAQGVVQDIVDEASVSTATPNWHTVLSC